MPYDDIYEYTGHMGRFQWTVFACMCGLSAFLMEAVNMVFVGGRMDHWCRVDELTSRSADEQRRIAIPPRRHGGRWSDNATSTFYSQCEVYALNWTAYGEGDFANWDRGVVENSLANTTRCTAWNYDTSNYISTIVSRFDLVCGSEHLVETVTSVYMLGCLGGTFSSGAISDKFGRRVALMTYLIIKSAGSALAIFAPKYTMFVLGRFIMGIGMTGCFLTAFVIVMEMVGPKNRTVVGIVIQTFLSVGFMMNAAIAYFVRHDFYFQLIVLGPVIFFVPIAFLIPESPRWLIVHGRYNDAKKVIQRICDVNGTEFPEDFDMQKLEDAPANVDNQTCMALVRSPGMRKRTLIMHSSWFTCALVYCALSMFSSHIALSSSLHLNTFISGAIEIPVNVLTMFLVDWEPMGRRGTGCMSLIGSGLTSFLCALMTMLEYSTAAVVLSLSAKAFITMAYTNAYLFGSEIFPTEVRNVGVGIGSMVESAGAIVAPFIGGPLARLWTPLPSIIYAVLAGMSGIANIFLPETLGQPLPDTIEQADEMAKKLKHVECTACSSSNNNSSSDLQPPDTKLTLDGDPQRLLESVARNGHLDTGKTVASHRGKKISISATNDDKRPEIIDEVDVIITSL